MGDGALVLDAQNRIVDINPAAQQLLGPVVARIGQSAGVVLASRPDLIERYRDVMEGQAEIVWSEDPPRHLELRISPVRDRRGCSIGRLVLLRDITGRKLAEEALQESNAELQAGNQELDAFAHTVAHDLKTPLNVIAGYAELLTEGHQDQRADEFSEYVCAIQRGVEKMTAIINSLLLLARARHESVPVGPLDTADILAEVRRRLAHEIELRQAEITMPATWPVAVGYGPWVEEVWVNYLSNALKYGGRSDLTPPVPPRVELASQVQAEGFVRFTIRDNGRGIASEDQKRLFVVLNRFGERREASHGLGLSIVRRIIERLGGQVGVESVVD
jgi:signal transduction histidine kinase